MIDIYTTSLTWQTDGPWRIAPAGLDWIKEGNRASIGEGASIGPNSADAVDLGHADGYRKCIAQVSGVAYIGAGCRWFTLADAVAHWADKPDRELTRCLLQSAVAVAALRGWAHLRPTATA